MVDFATVALTGFANGFGTIGALELWAWIKKKKLHTIPSDIVERFLPDKK